MPKKQTKKLIVVAEYNLPIVVLAPLPINYDLTVEEMVAGVSKDKDITSKHFPNCRAGKTGVEEAQLFLIRPVPLRTTVPFRKILSTQDVEKILNRVGFICEEIPALAALKKHYDELWAQGIEFIAALGPNSRWVNPAVDDDTGDLCLILDPDARGFNILSISCGWDSDDWFICRRK